MNQERVTLGAIIVTSIALRLAAIAYLDFPVENDGASYFTMAWNWVEGQGIVDDMGNRAMYNVGYPLFVLAPVFFVAGPSLLAAQLANVALGSLTVWLVWGGARASGASPRVALAAAVLYAAYLPALLQCEYLAKENLMTPLTVALAWLAISLSQSITVKKAVLAGGLVGALALVGSAALAFVPVIAVAVAWGAKSLRSAIRYGALSAAIATLIVVPWVVRNEIVLGAPVLNTNGGFNLYLGNNPAATGRFVSITDTPLGTQWSALRRIGELHASQVLRDEALHWIAENPERFLELAAKKLALFWLPPIHRGEGAGGAVESALRWIWLLQFLLIGAGALGALAIAAARNRSTTILWSMVLSYTALHAFFYVIFRYREPLIPILCVLAAPAIAQCLQSLNGNRGGIAEIRRG